MLPAEEPLVRRMLAAMLGGEDPGAAAATELSRMASNPEWHVLVFAEGAELSGFSALKDNPFEGCSDTAEIVFFYIEGARRRQGLGAGCLASVERALVTRGVRKAYVKVNPANRGAVSFWIMQGYEFEGRLTGPSAGQDLYVLGKTL
jgi:GNAT superfamily N-acetyltransferase